MAKQMENKVALVTGGASGIGRATALAFAREGAKVVVVNDVNVAGGEETAKFIKKAGGESIFVKCDVSKAVEVERMIKKAVEAFGRLDFAFNNSGISGDFVMTADCTEENWDNVININLKGVWLCMKYEIPQMLKQGGGAIVNTSSAAGLIGTPTGQAYCASKHGVVGLTKSAALEYVKSGIRINVVCPGSVRTSMTEELFARQPGIEEFIKQSLCPMGRIADPREVAEVVVWLCSEAASFITGVALPVDGGVVAGQIINPH